MLKICNWPVIDVTPALHLQNYLFFLRQMLQQTGIAEEPASLHPLCFKTQFTISNFLKTFIEYIPHENIRYFTLI